MSAPGGFPWILAAVIAVALLVLGLIAFSHGFVGGGDVKLMSAAALWAGPERVLDFLFITALIGGVLGILVLIWERLPMPGPAAFASGKLPYGVAIAAGAILARSFGAVVFDLPRSFAGDAAFIAGLDHIVLVSASTLTGLRDVVRLRTMLLGQGISETAFHVVINRVGMLAKGELDAKSMAAGGQLGGALQLPFDAKAAARAMTEAKPLAVAAARTKLGKALRLLAADVAPLVVEAPARGLARLFRRRA